MSTVTKARRSEHCIILAVTEKKIDSRWSCPTGKMIYHPLVLRSQAGDYSMSVRTAAGAHIYCGLPQEEACSPFEVNIEQHAGIVWWIFFLCDGSGMHHKNGGISTGSLKILLCALDPTSSNGGVVSVHQRKKRVKREQAQSMVVPVFYFQVVVAPGPTTASTSEAEGEAAPSMDPLVEGVAGMTGYFNVQVNVRGLRLRLGLYHACRPFELSRPNEVHVVEDNVASGALREAYFLSTQYERVAGILPTLGSSVFGCKHSVPFNT